MENLNFEINKNRLEESFELIANKIFNEMLLVCGKEQYRITEIEFYYYDRHVHPDPYTHKHPFQLKNKKWYFHPSGLDITLGNGSSYCGILLRGIIRTRDLEEIYGPLNLVSELFKNIEVLNNHKLQFGFLKSNLDKKDITRARRIGIKKEKSENYYNKNYRYLIYPEKKHKNKFDYQK